MRLCSDFFSIYIYSIFPSFFTCSVCVSHTIFSPWTLILFANITIGHHPATMGCFRCTLETANLMGEKREGLELFSFHFFTLFFVLFFAQTSSTTVRWGMKRKIIKIPKRDLGSLSRPLSHSTRLRRKMLK